MPLSDADRQRRHRERLKAKARNSDDVLDQLNRAYAEGEAEGIRVALARVKAFQARLNDPEFDAAWESWERVFLNADLASMPAEKWIQQAREMGEKLGEHLVTRAEWECLVERKRKRDAERTPPAPEPKRRRRRVT